MPITIRVHHEPPTASCPTPKDQGAKKPYHVTLREVRPHPTDEGMRQDRLTCPGCGHVFYDWDGSF